MPDDLARVEEIFSQALLRETPESRAAYLNQACGGDTQLRQRVDALLSAHESAGSGGFFEPPHLSATTGTPLSEVPGSRIGRYQLLQQIGEGGFGVVFMAEQEHPIRRRVALKIIKLGMDTRQVIVRFEAERQALAMMEHPNIAKVLDGGATETGRPYFVMELVNGIPITRYCDQHNLNIPKRIELFEQVCQAVQHAHQKGLIHRDIKPSNVLVNTQDDRPVAKIIDFGIAKATQARLTEKTLFTEFHQLVGTPEYMSPEQAEGSIDVDTRSDVYSLGVLLYELLTGTTPFDAKELRSMAYGEIQRIIREVEPPRPSTRLSTMKDALPTLAAHRAVEPRRLDTLVRGELDWIVMKCLEKDRSRRYETANGLAMDVHRYLQDEAVQACPPSAAYRFRKFGRRNKVALMTTAIVAVALILGTAISTWQAVRATRAERAAAAEAQRANNQAAAANASLKLIQEMLFSANLYSGKGPDYTVRQLMDDISARLGQQLKGQPELEAALRTTIAETYQTLGMTAKAKPHLLAALELLRQNSGEQGEPTARVLLRLAWVYEKEGDRKRAIVLVKDSLRIYRSLQSAPEARTDALIALQQFLLYDNPVESEQLGTEALAIARAAGESQRGKVAVIMHTLASTRLNQGHVEEAEELARQAIELHRQVHGADYPQTAWALDALGRALAKQGRSSEALSCFQESLQILRKTFPEDGKEIKLVLKHLQALETAPSEEEQQSGR